MVHMVFCQSVASVCEISSAGIKANLNTHRYIKKLRKLGSIDDFFITKLVNCFGKRKEDGPIVEYTTDISFNLNVAEFVPQHILNPNSVPFFSENNIKN